MKALICSNCGSTKLSEDGKFWVCSYCGTTLLKDADEIAATQINSTRSEVSLDNDVSILLEKCRKDKKNAKKYANLILDIDPHNQEALKYLK